MRIRSCLCSLALLASTSCLADTAAAKRWIEQEFQPSSLSQEQQLVEMQWFINAAQRLQSQGVRSIRVVSEKIDTHEYESATLAKAFQEITGIAVQQDVMPEGDLVDKLYAAMQTRQHTYDGWISDSDLIGTHYRMGAVVPLSDYMQGAGKEFTNPGLDLHDFIGTAFTTAPDGKMYQLPDQQFANLYWFRADWFARKDLRERFKARFGYELGVPLNWSAYEDIADFFGNDDVLYLMEDMATGEIRLSILWEWLHKKAALTAADAAAGTREGDVLSEALLLRLLDEEYAKLLSASSRDVHDNSKSTTLPIAREIVRAYLFGDIKPPWYVDLLNLNLDNHDLNVGRPRISPYLDELAGSGNRLTANLDFDRSPVIAQPKESLTP